MALFSDNTIETRVMAIVRQKIAAAQTAFDAGCVELESKCKDVIASAKSTRDQEKDKLAEKHVNSIVGKIL